MPLLCIPEKQKRNLAACDNHLLVLYLFMFYIIGGPAEFFYVDKISGTVRVKRQLDRHTKQYVLSVTATDQISNETAICKVILLRRFWH